MIFAILAGLLLPGLGQAIERNKKKDVIIFPHGWDYPSTTSSPPYPDVWGRKNPAPKINYMYSSVVDENGGDPLINFWWLIDDPNSFHNGQFATQYMTFFAGDEWTVKAKGVGKAPIPNNIPVQPINTFSDGSVLRTDVPYSKDWLVDSTIQCLLAGRGLTRIDPNGKIIWRRFMVQLFKRPKKALILGDFCSDIPYPRDRLYTYMNDPINFWDFDHKSLYVLLDDTFLAAPELRIPFDGNVMPPDQQPYIVRFDQDFRSPFIKDDDIYIFDMIEIESLVEQALQQFKDKKTKRPNVILSELIFNYLTKRGHR